MNANVTYHEQSNIDAAGETITRWIAHVDIRHAPQELGQMYAAAIMRAHPTLLTNQLTIQNAESLDAARETAAAALTELTGLPATSTNFVDLRAFNAHPAACESFHVAQEQRKAA